MSGANFFCACILNSVDSSKKIGMKVMLFKFFFLCICLLSHFECGVTLEEINVSHKEAVRFDELYDVQLKFKDI